MYRTVGLCINALLSRFSKLWREGLAIHCTAWLTKHSMMELSIHCSRNIIALYNRIVHAMHSTVYINALDGGIINRLYSAIVLSIPFKGTVSPDILILFMVSIIKSVLFVWPLIPLSFCYSFINFIFVYKVLIYILPITLELAHISLKSFANFASDFIIHYFFG